MLADLRQRTGLPVKRVAVGRIDFPRDTAEIAVYCDEPKPLATVAPRDAIAQGPFTQPRRAAAGRSSL